MAIRNNNNKKSVEKAAYLRTTEEATVKLS